MSAGTSTNLINSGNSELSKDGSFFSLTCISASQVCFGIVDPGLINLASRGETSSYPGKVRGVPLLSVGDQSKNAQEAGQP